MTALVDAYLRVAIDSGPASARTKATLLAAIAEIEAARTTLRRDARAEIAKLEAARDEATRRLAVVEEAVEAARKRLGKLVDHFEAMDGEEDSSQLAYDLQAISDGLRAALPPATSGEEKP